MTILHLTDVHFGHSTFGQEQDGGALALASLVIDKAEDRSVELVVISGDLTWTSDPDEFVTAQSFLGHLRSTFRSAEFVVVPGNHDVFSLGLMPPGKKEPASDGCTCEEPQERPTGIACEERQESFVRFAREFYGPRFEASFPLFGREDLGTRAGIVCLASTEKYYAVGVNSAAFIGTGDDPCHYGPVRISDGVLSALDDLLRDVPPDPSAARIFVAHHHASPVPERHWGKGKFQEAHKGAYDPTILADAGQLHVWLSENGFQILLHGHKHVTHASVSRPLMLGGQEESCEILTVAGAGFADKGHRPDGEVAAYSFIDVSPEYGRMQVRVDAQASAWGPSGFRSRPIGLLDVSLRSFPEIRGNYFHDLRASDCHRSIGRALGSATRVTNFVSVVDAGISCAPSRGSALARQVGTADSRPLSEAVLDGFAVPREEIHRAFRGLHPDFEAIYDPGVQSGAGRDERYRGGALMRFQLRHGDRIFGAPDARRSKRPFDAALDALKNGGASGPRRAYIGLYDAVVDAGPGASQPPPGLVGVQFCVEGKRLNIVASFRHLELSFWWIVNIYEMARLLELAVIRLDQDDEILPGSITFFAAMAEWQGADAAVAGTADLDVMVLQELAQTVRMAARGQSRDLEVLARLIRAKADATNRLNIVTVGLSRLVGLMRDMAPRGGRGFAMPWNSAVDLLQDALRSLDWAVENEAARSQFTLAASDHIGRAAAMVDGLALSEHGMCRSRRGWPIIIRRGGPGLPLRSRNRPLGPQDPAQDRQ